MLSDRVFRESTQISSEAMTIQGTVNKTGILLFLVIAGAAYTWSQAAMMPLMLLGVVVGLIAAIVTSFKPTIAHISAPIYAVAEGLALGGISSIFEARYPGIVTQAVGLTFGTFLCLLGAYKSGMIQVTENFKMGVVAATGGIFVVYLVNFILGLFGVHWFSTQGSGVIGIGFSLVVVVIASLNLVMDFDFIENAAEHGSPKYMEWYGAFALIVTLVWLYVEILNLLRKLNDRR